MKNHLQLFFTTQAEADSEARRRVAGPFSGSVIELWDSGPMRDGGAGTPVAPVGNVPPRDGHDPHEEPRNTVGELVSCPFCIAQWAATGYAIGLVFAPRATRMVGAAMTAVAASDWLQLAYAKLMKSV